jgi:hypothetical protein
MVSPLASLRFAAHAAVLAALVFVAPACGKKERGNGTTNGAGGAAKLLAACLNIPASEVQIPIGAPDVELAAAQRICAHLDAAGYKSGVNAKADGVALP